MYIPKNMRMDDDRQQQQFIQQFGFASLVSADLQVSHLPLSWDDQGDKPILLGHMARANPHWKNLDGQKVKALFHGPHSYISPGWYVAPPAVPTWNYAAVHVSGIFYLLDDNQLQHSLNALLQQYEPALLENEVIIPASYREKLSHAIVGFKIDIDQIEGKQKLGQHRSNDDQLGVAKGLQSSQHEDAQSLLNYMRQIGVGLGI
ncbi:FMN-binding negative transcriptional regulator [Neptunicella sp. SCSIO 80796]|uniref:FMN-binding negative transcriptional regulator n=1 Tax=Neptunicella plasticusilytica TaxID=3117012 RepID=UPI003A4D2EE0